MKIIAAEVFVTSPSRNFVTLRITTEDGVTGIGDATLNGRELAVAVMFLYPLTDRRHAEIVAEIAERRAAAGPAVPISPDLSTSAFRAQDATSPRPTEDD